MLYHFAGSHKHAATSAGANTYAYDANGNQTARHIGTDTFNLSYDAENRLVEVKKNDATQMKFYYDGDGKRVKSETYVNNAITETILFVGIHYEVKNPGSGESVSKYYFAGTSRIAMRKYTIPQTMSVEYTLGDHLGSTSLTTDSAGNKVSEIRYKPFGETRYTWTDSTLTSTPAYALTKYQFTGQFSYESEFGLLFYQSRFYDPALGRFSSPDTIIPEGQGTQAWDRYAYTSNNPVRYNDPTGHCPTCIGFAVGAIIGAGLYIYSESQQPDGFNIKEDWGDLLVSAGTMGVAGALIATPGFQAMGAGMAGSLVADHVGNIIGEEDFSAADNIVSGSIGAGAGYYGALATAGMSLVPAMVTTTVIGATMPIVAKSMGNHFSGTNYYDIEEELDEAIPNGASSGASTALSIATSPLLGTTGADVFANVATEIIKTEMEYCGEEICQR